METIRWDGKRLFLLDQTKIPVEITYLECETMEDVAEAIRGMQVRGAPAIGAAAAFGMVLAAIHAETGDKQDFLDVLKRAGKELASTRPTAVNLFWAINRMKKVLYDNQGQELKDIITELINEAENIMSEDIEMNRRIGEFGSALVPRGARIITHCNAGALATAGFGTALGIIRAAHNKKRVGKVWVDETRPLLQGARLTSWELMQEQIPATLITDSMAGSLMQKGEVDLAIVGADRITSSGDAANKIGTYSLAVLAYYHRIPFYVAAPWSTIDFSLHHGKDIPIEEREIKEVTHFRDIRLAPEGMHVYNPAFDVTSHKLITAIITDRGILREPYSESIRNLAD